MHHIVQNDIETFLVEKESLKPFALAGIYNVLEDEICLEIEGIEIGADSACVVVCDSLGDCDTTFIFVTVLPELIDAVNDSDTTIENTPGKLYPVLANDTISGTLDTIYLVGNITDNAAIGDIYRIFDFHLAEGSSLIDAGHHASVLYTNDIDGDNRHIDGDEDGYLLVDIGADEYDPNAGVINPIQISSPSLP